jgi:hypothetical protein
MALQSFLGLLFKEMAEILRFWQGGVNRKGATIRQSKAQPSPNSPGAAPTSVLIIINIFGKPLRDGAAVGRTADERLPAPNHMTEAGIL